MSALYFETETRRLARISAMATPHPTQRTTQVPTMAWLFASAAAHDKNPQICKALEGESDIGVGGGMETILACVIQNHVIKILNASDVPVQGNNNFNKTTYFFGTQQLHT